MNTDQSAFFFSNEKIPRKEWVQLHLCIVDRGSKYSVTGGAVEGVDDIKKFLERVKKDKKYAKATHNSYAARIAINGQVIERKSDDGETGAGMIILRQLRKANMVNVVIVVTRWYGGVKLHADRFKHVQDGTRLVIEELS
jgi:putative IMPACT (imprinted ancient) family translation regulator